MKLPRKGSVVYAVTGPRSKCLTVWGSRRLATNDARAWGGPDYDIAGVTVTAVRLVPVGKRGKKKARKK